MEYEPSNTEHLMEIDFQLRDIFKKSSPRKYQHQLNHYNDHQNLIATVLKPYKMILQKKLCALMRLK
jgi:hypothetical protein